MKTDTKIEPIFARVTVIAKALNMSRSSVYDLIRQGLLPATRIGGKLRVPMAALQRMADAALEAEAEPTGDDRDAGVSTAKRSKRWAMSDEVSNKRRAPLARP